MHPQTFNTRMRRATAGACAHTLVRARMNTHRRTQALTHSRAPTRARTHTHKLVRTHVHTTVRHRRMRRVAPLRTQPRARPRVTRSPHTEHPTGRAIVISTIWEHTRARARPCTHALALRRAPSVAGAHTCAAAAHTCVALRHHTTSRAPPPHPQTLNRPCMHGMPIVALRK